MWSEQTWEQDCFALIQFYCFKGLIQNSLNFWFQSTRVKSRSSVPKYYWRFWFRSSPVELLSVCSSDAKLPLTSTRARWQDCTFSRFFFAIWEEGNDMKETRKKQRTGKKHENKQSDERNVGVHGFSISIPLALIHSQVLEVVIDNSTCSKIKSWGEYLRLRKVRFK